MLSDFIYSCSIVISEVYHPRLSISLWDSPGIEKGDELQESAFSWSEMLMHCKKSAQLTEIGFIFLMLKKVMGKEIHFGKILINLDFLLAFSKIYTNLPYSFIISN